jgi:nicotinate-nucleotide pyrophosphorylase (carboxylating)
MKRVMKLDHGQALIEASGGMNLDNVRSVAEIGVDLISIGALTHSSKALDLSLKLVTC